MWSCSSSVPKCGQHWLWHLLQPQKTALTDNDLAIHSLFILFYPHTPKPTKPESLFSLKNHFRFWNCSDFRAMQDFPHTLKNQIKCCAWFFCWVFFFFFLIIFLNSSWPDEKTEQQLKKKTSNPSSKFGLCDWDLASILLMKCDQRRRGGGERWPCRGWTIATASHSGVNVLIYASSHAL